MTDWIERASIAVIWKRLPTFEHIFSVHRDFTHFSSHSLSLRPTLFFSTLAYLIQCAGCVLHPLINAAPCLGWYLPCFRDMRWMDASLSWLDPFFSQKTPGKREDWGRFNPGQKTDWAATHSLTQPATPSRQVLGWKWLISFVLGHSLQWLGGMERRRRKSKEERRRDRERWKHSLEWRRQFQETTHALWPRLSELSKHNHANNSHPLKVWSS